MPIKKKLDSFVAALPRIGQSCVYLCIWKIVNQLGSRQCVFKHLPHPAETVTTLASKSQLLKNHADEACAKHNGEIAKRVGAKDRIIWI